MALKNSVNDPIGIGIKYPLTFTRGSLALTADTRILVSGDSGIGDENSTPQAEVLVATELEQKNVIKQAINRTIKVRQGSQLMEGRQGSLVDLVPFEVNDASTQNLAVTYAVLALSDQVQRIKVINYSASQNEEELNQIKAFIQYKIRNTDVIDQSIVFERSEY